MNGTGFQRINRFWYFRHPNCNCMKTSLIILSVLFCFSASAQQWSESLMTKPEKTGYRETSTYKDVMDFITEVKKGSDKVTQISMGKSLEGKDIPVLVLANPKISNVEEAKASGKPIIYIQGNIHSGEVEGKEAVQILLREILHGDKAHLLDNQIILFTPIYNTDSNDKMDEETRRSQEGSPVKTGKRSNSQGWDLNRDGIKMETLESNGLIQNIIVPWDPTLFVDLHTTNGTWHGYSLTWAPSYHYAGEKAPYDFTWDRILPEVTDKVLDKYQVHLGPYGYYSARADGWPAKSISTYNHHPRYLVNQFGLRNRMAILSEAFAHERLYERITSTHAFVTEILEFTNKNGAEMMKINAQADIDAVNLVKEQGGKVKKGVRFKKAPLDKPINNYRTYDHREVKGADGKIKYVRAPNIIELSNIVNYSAFEATVESTLPKGYIIPAELEFIAKHLEKQGATVTKLSKNAKATGEVFTVNKITKGGRAFEKHLMLTVEGEFAPATQRFKKGDFMVDLAQPLANLIFYMLEPQSDDGLVTWNFFDEYFEANGIADGAVKYPIFKYFELK
jgi:Zinc carboxypeptidase